MVYILQTLQGSILSRYASIVSFHSFTLNFDFNADPDPAYHSKADPDPASKIMRIRTQPPGKFIFFRNRIWPKALCSNSDPQHTGNRRHPDARPGPWQDHPRVPGPVLPTEGPGLRGQAAVRGRASGGSAQEGIRRGYDHGEAAAHSQDTSHRWDTILWALRYGLCLSYYRKSSLMSNQSWERISVHETKTSWFKYCSINDYGTIDLYVYAPLY